MRSIRTLLVDDSPLFLSCLERFLEDQPQIKVIGTALSGRAALEQVAWLLPDLILLDLVMPDMNGLETLKRIRDARLATRVVVLSLQEEPELREEAARCGADDYVAKAALAQQLMSAVEKLFPAD